MIDTAASQEALSKTGKQFLSALPGESTNSVAFNKQLIQNKINNSCGNISAVQEVVAKVALNDDLVIDEYKILQKATPTLECQINAVSNMISKQKGESETIASGPLAFLENLTSGYNLIIIIIILAILGGGTYITKNVVGGKVAGIPIWLIGISIIALVFIIYLFKQNSGEKENYNGQETLKSKINDLIL
jgi:hypothetical protein